MKVPYFTDTDTLLMQLRDVPVIETRDLDRACLAARGRT
jgi:uncharacterized protein YuzE